MLRGITDNKFKISKICLIAMCLEQQQEKWEYICFDEIAYLNQRVGNIKNLKQVLIVSIINVICNRS